MQKQVEAANKEFDELQTAIKEENAAAEKEANRQIEGIKGKAEFLRKNPIFAGKLPAELVDEEAKIRKLEKKLKEMKTSTGIELAPPNSESFGTFNDKITIDSSERAMNSVINYYQNLTAPVIDK